MAGRTIALYGDSGSGKTTQLGELAKAEFRLTGRKTLINSTDLGGHDSLRPLERLGVVQINEFSQDDDPWIWINDATTQEVGEDIGLICFDSGTSQGEALLSSCAKIAMKDNIGGRPAPKMSVRRPGSQPVQIGTNVDSHYMVVQGFMLDAIWASTWLTRKGNRPDVVWTFATHRGENTDNEPIIGPKLAGKALTASIPKWFNYTFRLVAEATFGGAPEHVLYIQQQPGATGSISFGNARYPLDATTPLPAQIKPASVPQALELIEAGQQEAVEKLKLELGL